MKFNHIIATLLLGMLLIGGVHGGLVYDANTKYVLLLNGTMNSTTFTDGIGHTFAGSGSAHINNSANASTAILGNGAGWFNTGYISTPDSPDLDFGTNSFTIEYRVNETKTWAPGLENLHLARYNGGANYFFIYKDTAGSVGYNFNWINGGARANYKLGANTTFVFPTNQWNTIAIVGDRVNNTLNLYVNGTFIPWTTVTTAINGDLSGTTELNIGGNPGSSRYLTGFIDEVRISNIARYYAGYTPATTEFGTQGTTAPVASFTSTNISVATNSTSQGWAGVSPFTMQFNDTSTNTPTYGNYTYQGYGSNTTFGYNFSTSLNTTAIFTAGNFSVWHGAGNSNGFNLSTQTTWINVSANIPVATFTPSGVITGNNTVIQNFNDTSTGSPTTWNWSYQGIFAGNNTQTIWATTKNATGTFGIGNFSIYLNVTNNNGYNLSTQSTWINVTSNITTLTSDFTPNQTIGYQYPLPVTFVDNSTGATTYNYTFGDTYTSTLQSPSHIYTVANNYTVQQNVTNATGSYAISLKYVNLTTDDDVWLKSWLQFENASVTDLKGVAWTANGNAGVSTTTKKFGTQSLYIPAANPNSYISSPSSPVWDRSSVAGELEFWINITSLGQANQPILRRSSNTGGGTSNGWGFFNINATPNGYCFFYGSATNYTTPFTIPTNMWTHVALVRNTSQYWNVYLNGVKVNGGTYVDGLQLDTANPFTIGANEGGTRFGFYLDEFRFTQGVPRFVSDFSVPYAAYNGNLYQNYVNINPNTTLLYKSWPGYAQPVYNTTPHNRTVQIMNVTNATAISLTIDFPNIYEHSGTPFINATGAATYPDLALSNVVIDNNNGVDSLTIYRTGGGGISSLFDNRTSLVDIPVIYYNYTSDQYFDTYFASGNITDGQHSVTYPIYNFYDTLLPIGMWTIYPNFTVSPASAPVASPITFTDTSFGEITGWTTWSWNFGDGSTSTSQNPVYSYSASGNYTVSLTSSLIANTSVTNTTSKYVNITPTPPPAPIADFTGTPTTVTLGSPVQFNDTSANVPTSWSWAFGDGAGSSLQNPSHVYSSLGNYTVNLTATNSQGSNTVSKTNYIDVVALAPPVASFTPVLSSGQSPLVVSFTDTSTNIPTSWVWNFNDNTSVSTVKNPVHTFTEVGNHTVTLKAINAAGNTTAMGYALVTTPSGFNRQDLVMAPRFVLTVNFVDSATNIAIPVVRVTDSLGGNYTTTTGTFTGSYEYGALVLYCYSDGYVSQAVSYIVDSDRTETVQLVKASTSASTTWYTPKTVSFSVVDVYGNTLSGAIVNASYNSTTLIKGVSDLINNYGMNSQSANDALNGTLIMSGSTDSDGVIVFTMLSTVNYDIKVTYKGDTNLYQKYPQNSQYQLRFITTIVADNIYADLYANGNTRVWANEPDVGNVTFWWSFQDMSGLTTAIDYFLRDVDLNTTVYTTHVSSPVAGGIYQLNYTVPNARGKNYIAYENYTRNV